MISEHVSGLDSLLSEAFSKPSQATNLELLFFLKIVNVGEMFAKRSIFDV